MKILANKNNTFINAGYTVNGDRTHWGCGPNNEGTHTQRCTTERD